MEKKLEELKHARICKHLVGKSTDEASPKNQGFYDQSVKGAFYLCEGCRKKYDKSGVFPMDLDTIIVTLEFKN